MRKTSEFNVADYLDNEEVMIEYLNAVVEEDDLDLFFMAIKDIAQAKGMAQLAEESGLGRESLYKTLKPGAKPRFETIVKIVKSLGIPIHFGKLDKGTKNQKSKAKRKHQEAIA